MKEFIIKSGYILLGSTSLLCILYELTNGVYPGPRQIRNEKFRKSKQEPTKRKINLEGLIRTGVVFKIHSFSL